MRIFVVVIIFFSSLSCAFAQNAEYEQAAFDYFFKAVYENKKGVKWGFSSATEPTATQCFHLSTPCFKDTTGAKETYSVSLFLCAKLDSLATRNKFIPVSINANSGINNLYLRSIWLYPNRMMKVYHESAVQNKHYVMISLIRVYESTAFYFFELDNNKRVVRWCIRSDVW